MAQYKVPQNVEAEDKLLGPLSFRQFIYLLIAIAMGVAAYFFGTISLPLALIPAPVFFTFGILALPLRKDQPMETYLAAMIKFWFKPHLRLWDSDGQDSMVTIDAPTTDDSPKTKDFDGEEAVRRLSELSTVADSGGWSTLGLSGSPANNSLNEDFVAETNNTTDILDQNDTLSRTFDNKLHQQEQQAREEAMARLQAAAATAPQPLHMVVQPPQIQPIQPMAPSQFVHIANEPVIMPPSVAPTMPDVMPPEPVAADIAPVSEPTQTPPIPEPAPIEIEPPERPTPVAKTPTPRPTTSQITESRKSEPIERKPVIMERDNAKSADVEVCHDRECDSDEIEVKLH